MTTPPDLVILAGGRGLRLAPTGRAKPAVPLGGRPLTAHVHELFARHVGATTVVLGARATEVRDALAAHLPRSVTFHRTPPDLGSAGRIGSLLSDGVAVPFLLAWCDGLADVDVPGLLAAHRSSGALVTVLAVNPPTRFGVLTLDGDQVVGYAEKPHLDDLWVSGGIFAVDPDVAAYIDGPDASWEIDVLPRLAKDGLLAVYRHRGFWMCVDTPEDLAAAEALLAGTAPPPWRAR